MDYNSTVNQSIKSDFVAKHVFANVGSMVEYILKRGWEDRDAPFSWESDVSNVYSYPEYYGKYASFSGGTAKERDEEIARLREIQDEYNVDEPTPEQEAAYDAIRDEIAEIEALEETPQEVYEWWIVSDYLAEKLKEAGEVVIEDENIWGRGTSGQAILLDGVISQICEGMEILDGQPHSWAKVN